MDALWLFIMCVINFGISWWNASLAGRVWKDKAVMGFGMTLVIWSGVIMSAIGFSSVIFVGLMLLTPMFLEPEQSKLLIQWASQFFYLMIIFPCLVTGWIITVHSWIELFRQRNWVNLAVTSWNTYATISNTYDAYNHVGGALSNVTDMFGSLFEGNDDGKAAVAKLAIVLVLLSLVGGILLTVVIMQRSMSKYSIPKIEKNESWA